MWKCLVFRLFKIRVGCAPGKRAGSNTGSHALLHAESTQVCTFISFQLHGVTDICPWVNFSYRCKAPHFFFHSKALLS